MVLVAFAVLGAVGGYAWHAWWNPAEGVVYQHGWYTDSAGYRNEFGATGRYFVIAAGLGFALALIFAWTMRGRELVTALACLAGSVLGGWLMLKVGLSLSPPDPQVVAAHSEDEVRLLSALRISGRAQLAMPLAACLGVAIVDLLLPPRRPPEKD